LGFRVRVWVGEMCQIEGGSDYEGAAAAEQTGKGGAPMWSSKGLKVCAPAANQRAPISHLVGGVGLHVRLQHLIQRRHQVAAWHDEVLLQWWCIGGALSVLGGWVGGWAKVQVQVHMSSGNHSQLAHI